MEQWVKYTEPLLHRVYILRKENESSIKQFELDWWHSCNPSYSTGQGKRVLISRLSQKFSEILFKNLEGRGWGSNSVFLRLHPQYYKEANEDSISNMSGHNQCTTKKWIPGECGLMWRARLLSLLKFQGRLFWGAIWAAVSMKWERGLVKIWCRNISGKGIEKTKSWGGESPHVVDGQKHRSGWSPEWEAEQARAGKRRGKIRSVTSFFSILFILFAYFSWVYSFLCIEYISIISFQSNLHIVVDQLCKHVFLRLSHVIM